MLNQPNLQLYPESQIKVSDTHFALYLEAKTHKKKLFVQGNHRDFDGVPTGESASILCDLTAKNAEALRQTIPWLSSAPLGLAKSFGFGDRLGLATPGHIRAMQNHKIAPIFGQQSVRENARTGRTPQMVVDDAMWGVFQMGWKQFWGADADHLKTPEVLGDFIAAGYTFFTIDPGDHVDQHADAYPVETLKTMFEGFSWEQFKLDRKRFLQEWLDKEIPALGLHYDEKTLFKAIIKYGRAIAHTSLMYEDIVRRKGNSVFDFEVSVDETDSPTTVAEHFFIASELKRLGVNWTSLAPRFIGRFEKGVDYIGDLNEFDASIKLHAQIPQYFGDYKISLHSGSDKFSVYPSINRFTGGKLHVKTAGTSYLEALRVVAKVAPDLFAEILTFARGRYEIDKVTYHVSAELGKVPAATGEPMALFDQFDARQVFHVTYGSILEKYRSEIYDILRQNEEIYYTMLNKHFTHHLDLLS